MLKKISIILATSTFCALFIFSFMAYLISNNHDLSLLKTSNEVIDFSMNKTRSRIFEKDRKLPEEKKKTPPPPPQKLKPAVAPLQALSAAGLGSMDWVGDFSSEGGGSYSDIMPIVRINPVYPPSAAMTGTQGWVRLKFTITKSGSVRNVRILKSQPINIFDKSAVEAVSRWKYRPQMENGKAVSIKHITQLDFVLEKEKS